MPGSKAHLLQDVSLPARQLVWLAWAFGAGFLLAVLRQRAPPPGMRRFAAALPILLLNLLVPMLFNGDDEVLANFSVAIATAFISNFKLVGWILGRGSLVHPGLNAAQFAAVYALPITPAEDSPDSSVTEDSEVTSRANGGGAGAPGGDDPQAKSKAGRRTPAHLAASYSTTYMLARFFAKSVGLMWSGVTLHRSSSTLPRIPLLILEVFSQWMLLSISADGLGALVSALLGIKVSTSFECPYFATSVADFWNRRWNLVVSNVLRAVVYDPIMDGRLVARPGVSPRYARLRRLAAVFSVFVVSGLVHEALFWYQSGRTTPHLLWFWHFVLWGAIVIAENVGKRVFRKAGLELPTLLRQVLFQILLHAMLYVFWFPPLYEMGVMQKGVASIVQGWQFLQRTGRSLAASAALG